MTSRSKQPINWTGEHQSNLDNCLIHVTSPPVLAFPDFQPPFIHHTDASAKGLGCALYQIQENQLHILGYSSRTLVAAENKYHSSKLEFLAIKWAICEHFKDYLYYSPNFDVNFNPMTYLFTSVKVNATGQYCINCLISILAFFINPVLKTLLETHLASSHFLKSVTLNNTVSTSIQMKLNQILMQSSIKLEIMKHGLLQSINTVFIDIENQILYDVGDQKTTLVSLDLAKYWAEEK